MKTSTKNFLNHFDGHTIFVSMPEDNSRAPIHYHSGYEESKSVLEKRNNESKDGIFFTVNELDESLDKGRHRTGKMVVGFRAAFMDDDVARDNGPRDDFPLEPSLIVQSSKGKYHYYWLIDNPRDVDKDTWQMVQNGLINRYNGDKQARDLTRYLRLPGYNHLKNKDKPFKTKWQGNGNKYSWGEICDNFPPEKSAKRNTAGNIKSIEDTQSEEEIENIMRTAGDGLHGAINKFMLGCKRDGMSKGRAVRIARLLGEEVPLDDRDKRWHSRFSIDELERSYDGAEDENIELPDLPEVANGQSKIPWPPGLLGVIAQNAKDCARFQYDEVAIITALGLISGVCGRKFNFTDKGLNLYQALIMDTGMGKDSIHKYIGRVLRECSGLQNWSSFIGPKRFTGPKAIYHSLENSRSIICVLTEAGLLFSSKAGDQAGLQRAILGYLSLSGQHEWTGEEVFSDADKNLKPLQAPALSLISESTPKNFLKSLADLQGLDNGLIPRHFILRVVGDKPFSNKDHYKTQIDDRVLQKMKSLVNKCSKVQAVNDPEAWHLEADPLVQADMDRTDDEYTTMRNELAGTDKIKSIMAGRAFNTMTTIAALASVANHHELRIKNEEWQWAKSIMEYMMDGLGHFFQGSMNDPIGDVVNRYCIPTIVKILDGRIQVKHGGLSTRDHKAGKFKKYEFTQSLKNQSDVTELGEKSGYKNLTGAEVALEYMVRNELLYYREQGRTIVYTVTETFIAAVENMK